MEGDLQHCHPQRQGYSVASDRDGIPCVHVLQPVEGLWPLLLDLGLMGLSCGYGVRRRQDLSVAGVAKAQVYCPTQGLALFGGIAPDVSQHMETAYRTCCLESMMLGAE